jgi:hypothetical protein
MNNRRKEQNKEPTTQVLHGGAGEDNIQPTTEIVCGSDKVVDHFVQFMQKAQRRIDVCVDNTRPLLVEFKQIRDSFIDAKKRGVPILQQQ